MTKDQADDVVRVASSHGADARAEERDGDYVVIVGEGGIALSDYEEALRIVTPASSPLPPHEM